MKDGGLLNIRTRVRNFILPVRHTPLFLNAKPAENLALIFVSAQ